MRDYIGNRISIDGRMIGYRIFTAHMYFVDIEGMTDEEVYEWQDKTQDNEDIYELVNRVLAIKQSIWLLRRTSHSCQSLSDCLWRQETEIIYKLRDKYNFEFKEKEIENGVDC